MYLNLLLTLIIFNSFSENYSTTITKRAQALWINPAGLATNPGYEIFYNLENALTHHQVSILLNNFSFGLRYRPDTIDYTLGNGIKLGNSLFLGYSYHLRTLLKEVEKTTHTIGTIFRPSPFLSFGFASDFEKISAGLALRPLTDRITLFFDSEYQGKLKNYYFGSSLEPIPGLIINAQGDKNKKFKFGLEFSFGKIKIGKSITQNKKSVGLIVSRERYPTLIPREKRLVEITLTGSYDEDRAEQKFFFISFKHTPAFYNLLSNIKELAKRKDAYGILIKLDEYSLSAAQYEELKEALLELKRADKKIIFFAHSYKSLIEYQVVSIADYIILSELGDVAIPGIWVKNFYLQGTLDKLGIETDIEYIGKYKSAQEVFSRKDMSEAEKEQINAILDDFYYLTIDQISKTRIKEQKELEKLINDYGFFNSDLAKNYKLVDTTAFFYEVNELIKNKFDRVKKVRLEKFLKDKDIERSWRKEKKKIALVIAEGSIVLGKSGYHPIPLIGGKYIGSETMVEIFERIRKDKSIKAVVFRINSGGGSALASDIIASAVKKCDKEKPVIVSMGQVAGSGGYYIACLARKILANNTTITGSIGVLGVKLVTRRFYDEKLGITWDWLKRGEMVDAFSDLRHFTEKEKALFRKNIEWWYDKFITRVAEGRGVSKSFIDSISQGRIWSGKRAKELGLVDEIGGLLSAIELAKKEAKIKDDEEVEIVVYPKKEWRLRFGSAGVNFLLKLLNEKFLFMMPQTIHLE